MYVCILVCEHNMKTIHVCMYVCMYVCMCVLSRYVFCRGLVKDMLHAYMHTCIHT